MTRHYRNIYFGPNSWFKAVPGHVHGPEKTKLLVAATVADLLDGKTRQRKGGKVVRYTHRKLNGRFLLLVKLSKKWGGREYVRKGRKLAKIIEEIRREIKDPERKIKVTAELLAERLHIKKHLAEEIVEKTNPELARKAEKKLERHIARRLKHHKKAHKKKHRKRKHKAKKHRKKKIPVLVHTRRHRRKHRR